MVFFFGCQNWILAMSAGLLIGRLVFGALFAAHGAQKLFGWFGGYGLSRTGPFFEGLGFRPGRLFAAVNGVAEFGGGLLLALGLLEPLACAVIISVMIVAIVTVHWPHGLMALTNGVELPVLYAAAALSLALTGPGDYSLDATFGLRSSWPTQLTAIALVASIIVAFAALAMRRFSTSVSRA
jgi:putative oxidoreductase